MRTVRRTVRPTPNLGAMSFKKSAKTGVLIEIIPKIRAIIIWTGLFSLNRPMYERIPKTAANTRRKGKMYWNRPS